MSDETREAFERLEELMSDPNYKPQTYTPSSWGSSPSDDATGMEWAEAWMDTYASAWFGATPPWSDGLGDELL